MSGAGEVSRIGGLEQGRRWFGSRAWANAYGSLSRADRVSPLGAEDLELLATSAYMIGRDDEYLRALERSHQAYLEAGNALRALRCAFWVGVNLAARGEMGPASGWLGRAQRLVEREEECVERGYLLLPLVLQRAAGGEWEAAAATATDAAGIAQRFGDADLFALAIQERGNALVKVGRVAEGLGLLDEAMVAVTAGELSPIVTGLVYCSVIDACQDAYAIRRAREWTAALTHWCDEQPEMVAFTGRCLVHRAEILQVHGAWREALEETRRAAARLAVGANGSAAAQASYRRGELHRLRGEFAAAEAAYQAASKAGWEPQPGLALLRLAQGRTEAAAAAIRRVAGETGGRLKRVRLLPAYVEIVLAAGDVEDARSACRELEEIAADHDGEVLAAMVAQAQGEVALAAGDASGALVALRKAWLAWHELEAPYESACVRVMLGLACRALGDEDAAALELEAARGVFVELGARPALDRLDSLAGQADKRDAHGLTVRELEVLRLVATGQSNREIATALVISEHTVARHLQNIFTKLGLSSRTAAGAFAFEHDLV
jgi:DNA-binding CsgD family transcriptional regulator